MVSGLARLVLNKQALCGLRVIFWHAELGQELEGIIEAYDQEQDSFVLYDGTDSRYAVQFHQFTVEEEQQQLVLKVTKCTQVSVPQKYKALQAEPDTNCSVAADEAGAERPSDDASASGPSRSPSTQLSIELSQQLSGMIGRSFSHTTEGFAPVLDTAAVHTAPAVVTELINTAACGEQAPVYWGSPVKQGAAGQAAADRAAPGATSAAAVDPDWQTTAVPALAVLLQPSTDQQQTTGVTSGGKQLVDQRHAPAAVVGHDSVSEVVGSDTASIVSSHDSPCPSSHGSPYRRRSSLGPLGDDSPTVAAHAASISASFNSFQEISRMISTAEPAGIPIPSVRRSSSKHHHLAGVAARLLEETATWGTPKEGSPWGTPRELQLAEAGAADAATNAAAGAASPAADTARDELSTSQPCQQQQQQTSFSPCGADTPWLPDASETADELTSTIASRAVAGPQLSDLDTAASDSRVDVDTDFSIAAGVDVQPRPTSRTGARSARELYVIRSPTSTDAGMMVDIPQPLSSRRVSRTSVRAMQLGSDPGSAALAAGVPPAAELRRATSNMSSMPSRRISRTISNRLNADQDWTTMAHEAAVPQQQQQQLPPHPPGQILPISGGGAPVHIPGPTSRRTSRTLSGRLPLDQNGAVVVAQLPDDAAPDVSVRAVAAPGLETIVSRRQSSANGRPGTPDSDGFGYSEFEGLEPLVPPELAQWDAIVEEAAVSAGDVGSAAHLSHRHQRRSLRNLGATAPAAPAAPQRPSMRISDQDDGPFSPSGTGMLGSSAHQSGSERSITPVYEDSGSLVICEQQPHAGDSREALTQRSQHVSRRGSGVSNTWEAAGDGSLTAAAQSGSVQVSRGSSRKASLSGILQVAAAAAEAAAAAVGLALSGNKAANDEQQEVQQAVQQPGMTAIDGPEQQPLPADTAYAQAAATDYAPFEAGEIKTRLAMDESAAADSFSCPPFMPMAGSSYGTKSNPFADPSIFGLDACQQNVSGAAFQIGTAVAAVLPEQQELASFAAEAALLSKQQLPAYGSLAEGSEWGSGNFAPHITSGIDTPTGSGIFRTNPFAEGSDCGSTSPSHMSNALEGLPSALGRASIGASRMAREAAAAATMPFSGLSSSYSWKSSGVNISEITPASDDESQGDRCESAVRGNDYAASLQHKLGLIQNTRNRIQQAVAFEQQLPTAADDGAGSKPSADGSSVSSMWRLPPGYPESIGAEADDESSPSAAHLPEPIGQAWPAADAAADSPGIGGSSKAVVRNGAELDEAAAYAEAGSGASSQHQVADDSSALLGGATGLVRRTASKPTSRTTSQMLPNNVVVSSDGMVVLPAPAYGYEDDHQPLVQHPGGAVGYTPGKVPRTMVEARSQIGHVVLHTFVSISAQWFDIIALVVLGGQLMAAMASPQLSRHQQLSSLFWIFAAGHVLWPVGCLLWPRVTASAGSRAALAWTVCLSVFPTALLGCMPAYSEGAGAGLAVIGVLRVLSGIAQGNDGAAAVAYLAEHAPQAPHLHASLLPCAMATGALGAAVTALFFAWVLSAANLGVFGWRLTLVATLIGHGVSSGLRGFVLQDPEGYMSSAELSDRRNDHVWRVLRYHLPQVLTAILMQTFAISGFYLMTAWMPVYFMQYGQLPAHLALLIQTVNLAVLAGCIPLGGFLADQYGRTYVLLATCTAAALFAYPAWLLFSLAVAGVSWFSQFTLVVFVGLHYGALNGALVEMFPKGVRSCALNLVTVLPMVLLGSTTPLAALGLITQTDSLSSPAILMIVTAVVSAAAVMNGTS